MTYQATVGTKHKGLNVLVHQLLERIVRMRTIDNGTIGLLRVRRLRTQLGPKELVDFTRISVQGRGDLRNVRNIGLDSISGSFNLAKDSGHLVAIGWIIDWRGASDINDGSSSNGHDGNSFSLLKY